MATLILKATTEWPVQLSSGLLSEFNDLAKEFVHLAGAENIRTYFLQSQNNIEEHTDRRLPLGSYHHVPVLCWPCPAFSELAVGAGRNRRAVATGSGFGSQALVAGSVRSRS